MYLHASQHSLSFGFILLGASLTQHIQVKPPHSGEGFSEVSGPSRVKLTDFPLVIIEIGAPVVIR